MTKVITVGVFDLFHIGHLNLLEKAASFGDTLVVGVHDDCKKSKGCDFFYSLETRIRIVNSLKCVDKAFPYERVDKFAAENDFDVFVYGEDQNHKYFQETLKYCKDNGKKCVMIPRTDGISSSELRTGISNDS